MSLHFELHCIEGGLHQVNRTVVAVMPLRIFVNADQKLQGELFEDVIVGGLEIVTGTRHPERVAAKREP